jgi:hypothetical protein
LSVSLFDVPVLLLRLCAPTNRFQCKLADLDINASSKIVIIWISGGGKKVREEPRDQGFERAKGDVCDGCVEIDVGPVSDSDVIPY